MTKINQRHVGGEEIGECSVCGHKVCAHVLGEVAQVHLLRATEEALVKTAAERDKAEAEVERLKTELATELQRHALRTGYQIVLETAATQACADRLEMENRVKRITKGLELARAALAGEVEK